MIIYFDENMPYKMVSGFHQLQSIESSRVGIIVEVRALVDDFGEGCKDEEWIPKIGAKECCVITQDHNIHRKKAQRELYNENNVGIFIIVPKKNKGIRYWEMVSMLVAAWPEILKILLNESRPFAYKITPKGKVEKLK